MRLLTWRRGSVCGPFRTNRGRRPPSASPAILRPITRRASTFFPSSPLKKGRFPWHGHLARVFQGHAGPGNKGLARARWPCDAWARRPCHVLQRAASQGPSDPAVSWTWCRPGPPPWLVHLLSLQTDRSLAVRLPVSEPPIPALSTIHSCPQRTGLRRPVWPGTGRRGCATCFQYGREMRHLGRYASRSPTMGRTTRLSCSAFPEYVGLI